MIPLRILLDVEQTPIVSEVERMEMQYGEGLGLVSAIGGLTEGTKEGRPVVIIRIDRADGTFVLGETSLRLLQTAMIAFRARYGDLTE